jgi:carbonic anhydrase
LQEAQLLQFHFHTFSEHTIKSERGAMELHAVFKDENTGNLAVIGMIYRLGRVQPAGRDLEVLVGRAEGVGGMDAAVKPTWRYSRRPLA